MLNDLQFALRNLSRSPGFSVAVILTLTIAIGANTAMFSILYAVVLEPLPFPASERLMRVWETDQHNASFREGASMPDLVDWQKQQRVFSHLAGTTNRMLNLTQPDAEAERIAMTGVSHDYFSMLGVRPLAGRAFIPADDRNGAEPVAVISDSLWQRRFARENVIGRAITLDGRSHTIVGVMSDDAALSRRTKTDVWTPLTAAVFPLGEVRGIHNVYVIGRLREGVTPQQAQNEMRVIAARLEQQYPDDNKGRGVFVEPLFESMVRDARPRLYILGAAVVAVLLIACINVAGLMLARADTRVRELAIRASLGATRGRIVRQLLTESFVLAVTGGVLAIALAWWATRTLLAMAPALPRAGNIGVSVPVLLFALGASVLSAILFGVIPAIRTSNVHPALALGSTRGVIRGTKTAGRSVLVIAEVALAVVLVIGAGLLLKSFARLMAVDVGLQTSNIVTLSMTLPEAKYPPPSREQYPDWPEAVNFYERLTERMAAVPGVQRAALGMAHPLDPSFTSRIAVAGRPESDGPQDEVRIRPVTAGYFETLGITLLRGRTLTRDDRPNAPATIVINDALARKYFPREEPLGKQLVFWGKPNTIVGVVRGERLGGPQNEPEPALYAPLARLPMSDLTLVVRSTRDPAPIIADSRAAIRELDPDLALYDVELLSAALARSVVTPKFQAVLIASFGAIALLLAAIGLYALIAYQVQQRTNEIGVRLALGATRGEIAALVLKRAALLAAAGIAIGLAGAFAVARFLQAMVFEISTRDPAIYIAVPLLLAAIALLATWLPARRAMQLDPAMALHVD
ncbi:MAG TPA: ABC transporter permease [Thermoanaerobaculia bacterium]|nr:ABC transporter permease [Thermoanaerobaculia bacterium]